MLKLSQKKRKAFLALAVAAAVLGANNAFAASVHDKAISESNQFGSAMRTYWKEAGVYNAKTHTYTFNEDVTLKPKASEQDFNNWTPMFGGIYIARNNPVTIDMQGHRLDIALNVDQPNGVTNVYNVNPHAIHVTSADLVINNVKGMELSAAGSFLSRGKLRGIYVAGTNQEGSYGDGKGLASLTINNADGWENAVKFHSSQPQVENAIEVWKNTGSADLKISGMVDLYVGNDSDVITVRGGNSAYDIDKVPTAYIGGGAIKAAMGRAANVSGGELYINSKLQDGAIVAVDGSRDVQVEGNILVKDQQKDQGILTLGMNTDKSYFKGTIFNDNGAGDAYMLLANGAQWTNESKGDYSYHGSSLKQLAGGASDAKAGNIFQKDSSSLTIDSYSGNTNIFYAHSGNGEAAENYAAGNTVIKSAAKGSVVSMITDNTGVAMDNKDSVANVLNALAGKLTYSNYVNGENNLTGYVKIADGLTASSAALKTGDITFNKEDGKGSYSASAVKPEVPAVKEYTKTLTGFNLIDEAYADVIKDGVYKFTEDSKIINQYGMDIVEDAQIDATGKTLTLVVDNPADQGAGIKVNPGYSLNIKADTVKMELTGEDISSNGLKGINITKAGGNLTIDGKLDITANGDNNTIGVYNQGNVVVNGDVKLNIEGNNGGYQYYGATGLYATSAMGNSKGGTITVNGNVDFQGNANGIWANAGGAVVDVNGGGSIIVKEGQDMGYAAIKAENGIVNMNVLKDEAGNVTGADNNAVTIKGNLSLDTGAVNSVDIHGVKSEINLGLSTAESSLTGVVQNSFGEAGKKAGDKTFTGDANLWLQNGATWNNEVVDEIIRNPWGGEEWAGSRVNNFTGGASDAKAGNIFQNDSNNLTIDNYSGNTNIFYAHSGNGEAADNYAAGDTVIKSAAEGSAVSLITDNTGVAMDNKDSVANVLNALAGKLTYSNYVNGENNLTGYVKIADGLTASSAALKTGDITFKEDGKGSYVAKPEAPTVKEYKDTLTGFDAIDEAYADVIKDGVYKFAQDTKITNQYGMDIIENAQIDASGNTLTLVVDNPADTGAGIKINAGNSLGIKADTLKMELSGKELNTEGLKGINLIKLNTNLTVDGNLDITADGDCNTIGVYSQGNVVVNGDAKLNVEGHNGGTKYYGASGIYATSGMNNTKGGSVTVNGNVDFQGNANGLFANSGGAVVTVKGGSIVVDSEQEMDYAAIRAEDGTVNMNVLRDEAGKVTGADNNDVNIKGNVVLSTGAANASDIHGTESAINLGLTTASSNLTGVVANYYGDKYTTGGMTFTGAANLWLQNGATWNNEEWGEPSDDFEGSRVANFVGGASEGTAGNIFQKDSNELTIDNYSGNTNIFYAHTGNGEAAANYAAGDTVIKHAEKDSAVSLITDNTGVAMDNKDSVANVLNALAGKLTYSNYVNGESNLTGYVKIADGLTASSAALKTGDITFSKEDGKGSYPTETPVVPPKTEFTTALTGDTAADTEYAGNIQDGKYVFGANTTINAAAKNAVEVKAPLTIDAGNNQLVLMAKQGDYTSASPLFKQAVDGTTSIKAGKLVIKNGPSDFNERTGMEVTKGSVDITGDVDMKLSSLSNAYGVYVKANGSKVAVHGDLKLADSEQFDSINGLYVENTVDFNAKTSAITVDGKADINLHNGNAITAIRNGSTVSVGGGNIKIAKNSSKEFYALQSDGGVVNVNMNADKNAAGTATTVIEGNISAYGEKANKAWDMDVTDSIINIGLADKKSSWTGTACAKDLGTGGLSYKGIVNLYLANGATWNNEAWGKTNAAFDGSHVTKLAGGASEAAAGNIFQKDSNNLTIDNYSGNTNIFYAHTGNGENASNYAAGDTIIKSAAAGSAVSLITDNTGISMDNDASVANVLNTLAGKLTYSNFVNGESNLNGSVKIADGLTSSSQTMKVDTIKFNKDTGKGYTKEETVDPGAGEKTTFTDAITGEKQGVYSAVQQEDLSYVFAEDASVTINQMTHKEADPDWAGSFIISGAAIQNAAGVENLVINAADKTLKLNVALDDKTVPPDKNAGILNNRIPLRGIDNSIAGSTTSVTAGTLDINVDNTYSRKTSSGNPMIGEGGAIGIYAKSAGEKAVVEVTGNTAIKAHGYNNVYGVNANGNAEIKLHGDLTMAKDGEDWAIDNVIKGQNTTTLGESSWRNIAGINANGAGANVTVDGKTTIAAHGSGVVAADGATVNLGAADIEIKNNSSEEGYGFHALGAALGTVNVGGEGKTVTVKGNAGLFGKQGQQFASDSKESVINLKLTDAESAWTGVAYKHFTDAEKEAGLSGSMNLTLANGASWNNEKYGYVYGDSEWEKYKFTGSEIANFVGGASDAKAGNIFQKDANSLTIDNYSGNTNIFYAHTGNGEAADNYAAGDTVIKHAAEGSVVSMITDNTGISMDNRTSVNNVLNALAGKLTYSNFVNGEKNLTGYVKIADGLTASSAALKTEDITFNEEGKGTFVSAPVIPDHQVTTSFTTTLTGDKEKDNEYLMGGVIAEDGTYKFTEASDITAVSAIETAKDLKIDATGKTLTVNTAGTDSAAIKVLNDGGSKVDITADKLVIKSSADYAGKNSGIYAGDWNTTRKNVTINAAVDITATNTVGNNNNVYGVLASKADITVNGNLKANIDGGKGGYDHTSVSALIAQGSSYRKYASTITVNGDVDITANGNGLHANNNGAVVTVNGGGAITVNDSSAKGGYAALRAGNGTVNMNVALENGKATGGLGHDVAIKGNLAAVKAGDQTASVINLALDTAKSSLEGVSYMTEGNGQINLWLQNGASWTNEVHGSAEKDWKGNSLFNGSHVTNFAGGVSDAKAGNIFQKDSNSLTIDNYSGNTNIFYAHTGNGEAASDYAAGDTVIKHAAEGSVVSMITDNTGISMDNRTSVNNVLNALAGKLTYSNFVNGEKNLTGYVKIADGLTASSKAMQTGNISFSTENGKGSLESGSMTPGITYPETQKPGSNKLNQGITGNAKDDYQLKMDGILKADGSYVFTQDPTVIEVKEGAAVDASASDIVIDTTKAKLELKGADAGINADGANVNIKGNTNISGATGINAESGNVTLTGSTVINGTNAAINAGAGANVTVDGNNSALKINGSINADGGNITVDSGKATSAIKGDINASNGGSVAINLTEKSSELTGGYNVDGTSSIDLSLANGATWHLTDGEEAAGMSLLRMAKGAATAGLTINGGKTEAEKGFLDMTERTKTLDIAHYSGWETIIYDHEGKGDKVEDYKSGDTVIAKADKGSGVILSTDKSGINMKDKDAVEATLKALAQKVTYKDHEANGENLTGKVQIAEGLTSSSVSKNLGTIHWDENGKGQYDLDSVNWNQIIEGDYETFVMKGVRSAATTSLHTWRDNMQDTYTGADLADEDGMFAKALGGKTSS
ncbi:beta strand repeat-containing protein, partial [Phascolarctobacterium succinatutens]|uniref:beta strand repeat-containing protein n=1 Tax=Phascolarctobacterium succinatutens TaxID=626940 RepID=UPI0026EA1D0A